MIKLDVELKKDMNSLRETLYRALSEDKDNIEKILEVSQELDKLIVEYTKQNREIVA